LYVITQTSLLKNRHIDQVIMCVLYALAKVTLPNRITFKAIIEKYHCQPQAKSYVYRYVPITPDEDADIIQFYNRVLLPTVEKFLLEFQVAPAPAEASAADMRPADLSNVPAGASTDHLQVFSPLPKSFRSSSSDTAAPRGSGDATAAAAGRYAGHPGLATPSTPPSLPRSSSSRAPNLHISPLRTHSATPLLLHHRPAAHTGKASSISYQFGLSPHKHIDDINKSVNRETARKKLDFDSLATLGSGGSGGGGGSGSGGGGGAPALPVFAPISSGPIALLPEDALAARSPQGKPSAKRKLNLAIPDLDTSSSGTAAASASPSKKPKPTPF
jgi:uncharacterized membrane protein YgcG